MYFSDKCVYFCYKSSKGGKHGDLGQSIEADVFEHPNNSHCYGICKGGVIEDVLYTLRNYIESEYINIAFKT